MRFKNQTWVRLVVIYLRCLPGNCCHQDVFQELVASGRCFELGMGRALVLIVLVHIIIIIIISPSSLALLVSFQHFCPEAKDDPGSTRSHEPGSSRPRTVGFQGIMACLMLQDFLLQLQAWGHATFSKFQLIAILFFHPKMFSVI